MIDDIIKYIRDVYETRDFIPLHAPTFLGNEKKYILDTIDTTFVSSVGAYVDRFEVDIQNYTDVSKAVATVNGTAALYVALYLSGVGPGDVVITQALTFVATCNAITQLRAEPAFVDVSEESLGMCPLSLQSFLEDFAELDEFGKCRIKSSGKVIKAVVPMHTFGHPVQLDEISNLCEKWNLVLIEDAAESLGSFYKGRHTGTVGRFAAISFNGNKIITTGGGGMLLCKSIDDGLKAKHVTTTAKLPHPYEFIHDEMGFNYRLPNLNAALGVAQFEQLTKYIEQKRMLANRYEAFFSKSNYIFVKEPIYAKSNYWLNAILCPSREERDELLTRANQEGVMTRPIWTLMTNLEMFKHCLSSNLVQSAFFESRLVNIPSSPK